MPILSIFCICVFLFCLYCLYFAYIFAYFVYIVYILPIFLPILSSGSRSTLSSLTRKRLAEFRAPDSVGDPDVLSEIVVNIDHVDNSHDIKKTKYCDQIINTNKTGEDTEIVKGVQKKSSSGNLLSFVTKMKFNTTKLKLDSDYDPFKQDDLDAEFGLDM